MMKRFFDLLLTLITSPVVVPVTLLLMVIVKLTSSGPAIHWSKRVGKSKSNFMMAKLRTMRIDTPQVATHLLGKPDAYLTPAGRLLRKLSLDELPQWWNVLIGQMSFVGPRPALYNQDDLVKLRDKYNISDLTPGITGWAQINGRDELSIPEKVKLENFYYENRSFLLDIKILWLTFWHAIHGSGIHH